MGAGLTSASTAMVGGVRFPLLGIVRNLLKQPERFGALRLRALPCSGLLRVEIAAVAGGSEKGVGRSGNSEAHGAIFALKAVGAGAVEVNCRERGHGMARVVN
jgi:hypothetical protein